MKYTIIFFIVFVILVVVMFIGSKGNEDELSVCMDSKKLSDCVTCCIGIKNNLDYYRYSMGYCFEKCV